MQEDTYIKVRVWHTQTPCRVILMSVYRGRPRIVKIRVRFFLTESLQGTSAASTLTLILRLNLTLTLTQNARNRQTYQSNCDFGLPPDYFEVKYKVAKPTMPPNDPNKVWLHRMGKIEKMKGAGGAMFDYHVKLAPNAVGVNHRSSRRH